MGTDSGFGASGFIGDESGAEMDVDSVGRVVTDTAASQRRPSTPRPSTPRLLSRSDSGGGPDGTTSGEEYFWLQHDKLLAQHEALQLELAKLQSAHAKLQFAHAKLQSEFDALRFRSEELRSAAKGVADGRATRSRTSALTATLGQCELAASAVDSTDPAVVSMVERLQRSARRRRAHFRCKRANELPRSGYPPHQTREDRQGLRRLRVGDGALQQMRLHLAAAHHGQGQGQDLLL